MDMKNKALTAQTKTVSSGFYAGETINSLNQEISAAKKALAGMDPYGPTTGEIAELRKHWAYRLTQAQRAKQEIGTTQG